MAVFENIIDSKFDRIVFVHIPKNAGSSLRSFYQGYFGAEYVASINPILKQGKTIKDSHEYLLPRKFILGHAHFQVFQEIPGKNLYISTIRDPFDRTFSLYRFISGFTNPLDSELRTIKDLSFEECLYYYEPFIKRVSNRQTELLGPRDCEQPSFNLTLDILQNNNFILSTLDDIQRMLQISLNYLGEQAHDIEIPHKNRGTMPYIDNTEEHRSRIEELNQEDYALYNALKEQSL